MKSYSEIPAIRVLIKPVFDSADNVTVLSVSLTIDARGAENGSLYFPSPISVKELLVGDEGGPMEAVGSNPLSTVTLEESGIRWNGDSPTSGKLKMSFQATPGPHTDLRCDHGGVLGSGQSFLMVPQTDQVYQNIVEWDLSQSPAGTRTVWTFGEGPSSTVKLGPPSTLSYSVYMIGKFQSNYATSVPRANSDYYGYYWFGDLPANIAVIKDIHYDFFVKVSEYFQDPPSVSNTYRSFVRSNSTKSFGGKNYLRSYIFDYDDQISVAQDYDLIRRMAYEMVYTFLGPSCTDHEIDWLVEGIKNTLSIYFPFRFGFRRPDYFESTIAMNCMKYYTNPFISLSHEEALKLAPTNAYVRELISSRAWAFVILTDYRSRVVAEEKRPDLMPRPMEDMAIRSMALKKRNGERYGIDQWIEHLEPLMGDEIRKLYEHMKSGAKIILPERFFGSKTHRMANVQQEMLEFGVDRDSFELGVVKGLKEGSRAEKAGLKEGDKIIGSSNLWKCVDTFEAEMEVVVEREGDEKTIRYWPRSIERVESLVFVKLEV